MKKALVILDANLQHEGWVPGVHYEFVGNIHDEWQMETTDARADALGQMAVDAIRKAGYAYAFKCPLDGQYEVGDSWAETH